MDLSLLDLCLEEILTKKIFQRNAIVKKCEDLLLTISESTFQYSKRKKHSPFEIHSVYNLTSCNLVAIPAYLTEFKKMRCINEFFGNVTIYIRNLREFSFRYLIIMCIFFILYAKLFVYELYVSS